MRDVLVSVVMPAFNAEAYAAEAIESILRQTHQALEVIIVDDGSTDNTPRLTENFARRDSRIRVIRGEHCGISSALNKAVTQARGNWVAVMHADDVALPHRIEKQLEAAEKHPSVVVWGAYARHIGPDGHVLGLSQTGPVSVEAFESLRRRAGDVQIVHPTAMFRRDVFQAVGGYDSKFDGCEDFELWDRMAAHGPVVAITEPLLHYRIHSSSVSVKRFTFMHQRAGYVKVRARQRLAGVNMPSLENYLATLNQRGLFERVIERAWLTSGFCYRSAGMALGKRRYLKAAMYLSAAVVVHPHYALRRVWAQVLGRRARVALHPDPTLPSRPVKSKTAEGVQSLKSQAA